jgi:CheY-like chemotaxis protein
MQLDSKRNRTSEGTGLGLAITKQLCIAMGGDITMTREYGKGSTFTVPIPQGIASDIPFADVTEPKHKKVLVYERRDVYAGSLSWSLDNLGVPHTMVSKLKDFTEALSRQDWFFVFSGYGLYEKIKPVMDKTIYPNGKQPPLALMIEWGTENFIPNVRFVSLPVQSLSIANTLNGKLDRQDYFDSYATKSICRFTIPDARILVVDDLATNLKVAEGLLAPYKAIVDTCLSGAEAIELVKRHAKLGENYNLIFMDHMMPEMDGIETTAIIRAWEKEQHEKKGVEFPKAIPERDSKTPKLMGRPEGVPIIALTANAVSGMREMFLENGFNDFLAKPVDISKLDEMLDRWIVQEIRTDSSREERKKKKEKKLVLLVDDNPSNLKSGRNILKEKYNVISSPTIEKMLKLLESNSPDLILLGENMPQPEQLDLSNMKNDSEKRWSDRIVLVPGFDFSTLVTCVENYFMEGHT